MQVVQNFTVSLISMIKIRLTVPILPFSKIDEMGAGMYKGEKITIAERNVKK